MNVKESFKMKIENMRSNKEKLLSVVLRRVINIQRIIRTIEIFHFFVIYIFWLVHSQYIRKKIRLFVI